MRKKREEGGGETLIVFCVFFFLGRKRGIVESVYSLSLTHSKPRHITFFKKKESWNEYIQKHDFDYLKRILKTKVHSGRASADIVQTHVCNSIG